MKFLMRAMLVGLLAILAGCASLDKTRPTEALSTAPSHPAAAMALQLQGSPYVLGGASPEEGFDCSGLVYYVYQQHGIDLPRDAVSQANALPMVDIDQRQPGDLVFFNIGAKRHSHVGIYVGEEKFVHAPSARRGKVVVSDLNRPYWRGHLSGVRRPHRLAHKHASGAPG